MFPVRRWNEDEEQGTSVPSSFDVINARARERALLKNKGRKDVIPEIRHASINGLTMPGIQNGSDNKQHVLGTESYGNQSELTSTKQMNPPSDHDVQFVVREKSKKKKKVKPGPQNENATGSTQQRPTSELNGEADGLSRQTDGEKKNDSEGKHIVSAGESRSSGRKGPKTKGKKRGLDTTNDLEGSNIAAVTAGNNRLGDESFVLKGENEDVAVLAEAAVTDGSLVVPWTDAAVEEEDLSLYNPPPPARSADTKAPPVLPWMRFPVEIGEAQALRLDEVPNIDPRLAAAMRQAGMDTLFPVQAAMWHEMVGPGGEARDLCVCAPTGSGKTLSYALPIVQQLSSRVIQRLRALVVLPTRDLAVQVKAVFDTICTPLGLAAGLAVGQSSMSDETALLVTSGNNDLASSYKLWPDLRGAVESRVDILVATPGRLIDHMNNTRGFSLQHLRYLVVDETDRLLRQSYQDWLPAVLAAAQGSNSFADLLQSGWSGTMPRADSRDAAGTVLPFGPVKTVRREYPDLGMRGVPYPRLVKLVLSATLTRDPTKISRLDLHHPLYITSSASDHRYKLPSQLQEFKLVCKAEEKPLVLAALLQELRGQSTIIFTASLEATHRLRLLLQAFEDLQLSCVEYSSLQPQRARSKALEEFRSGAVEVLVASDAMTRGMDVESVANVISYDMPVYIKTYVHRAGRTARAGRPGRVFTIMRKEEVRHFKGLLRKADNNYVKDFLLPPTALEELTPQYVKALEKLKFAVEEESAAATGKHQPSTQAGAARHEDA